MQNVRTSVKVFSGSYRNFYVYRVNVISESLRVCAMYYSYWRSSVRVTPNFEPIVFSFVFFGTEILLLKFNISTTEVLRNSILLSIHFLG